MTIYKKSSKIIDEERLRGGSPKEHKMTNGLVKGRITYFTKNGMCYQAYYDKVIDTTKIFVYVNLGRDGFICCSEHREFGYTIKTIDDLAAIAEKRERSLRNII